MRRLCVAAAAAAARATAAANNRKYVVPMAFSMVPCIYLQVLQKCINCSIADTLTKSCSKFVSSIAS